MSLNSFGAILQPWILPPGLCILLGLVGLLFWIFYWRKTGKTLVILAIFSIWIMSAPIVAYQFVNYLQNQYPLLEADSLTPSNTPGVIIVLGGGDKIVREYGNKHTVSDTTLQRLKYAAYLHSKTQLPILVSGGCSKGALIAEADLMHTALIENFQIRSKFKEGKSLNTADESKFLAPFIRENNFKKIYLVTNAWHMPRSVYIFKKAGIDVIPSPMGYLVYDIDYKSLLGYLPNKEALNAMATALHEYIGLLWYHIRYRDLV